MSDVCLPVTHRLKKTFRVNDKEVYWRGTPAYYKRGAGNVALLTPTGRVRACGGALSVFTKLYFFRPFGAWFEPVRKSNDS